MNKEKKLNYNSGLDWVTVSVIALAAGWRNVYRLDDGSLHVTPCPALMVQELRETWEVWDREGVDGKLYRSGKTTKHEAPYETRVVFTSYEGAQLDPVDELSNYVMTIGPGEEPSIAGGSLK